MTYLQIVNSVLRLLRESAVTSVSENSYSTMVGGLVNLIKDEVEGAWRWNVLRNTISINTVTDTFRYVLTGAGTKSVLLDAYNDTSNGILRNVSAEWLNHRFILGDANSGVPSSYGINGSDASGDIQIDVYPVPDAVYKLDINLILKQATLEEDSDIILVPSDVVVLGAWALAVSERGEDSGIAFNEIDQRYKNSLGDAIAIDASNMHPTETTWQVV